MASTKNNAKSTKRRSVAAKAEKPESVSSGKKIVKGATKPADKAAKAKPKAAAKPTGERKPRGPRMSDDATIKILAAENPHREGSKGAQAFAIASKAGTVGKFRAAVEKAELQLGPYLSWAQSKGWLKIVGA